LPDPRVHRTRRHALVDILVITLCAAICGADDGVAIARFGRVFAALDPDAFRTAFLAWVQTVAEELPGEVIAVDGKTLRRTFDTASAKAAIHIVSAWAAAQGLCLGQVKTDTTSNEITAIPKLLKLLARAGRVAFPRPILHERQLASDPQWVYGGGARLRKELLCRDDSWSLARLRSQRQRPPSWRKASLLRIASSSHTRPWCPRSPPGTRLCSKPSSTGTASGSSGIAR
jgi:hypothetical protein